MTCKIERSSLSFQLEKIVGQRGDLKQSLAFDKENFEILYPLRKSFVVQKLEYIPESGRISFGQQKIFKVDVNEINCFKFSNGIIVIGEKAAPGSWAKVLVLKKTISNGNELDYTKYMEYSFHLSSIESVDISMDLKYLASLGGPDDENMVISNLVTRKLVSKAVAQQTRAGKAKLIAFLPADSSIIVTAGNQTLRFSKITPNNSHVSYEDAKCSSLKKSISAIQFSSDGKILYCGTDSGEIAIFSTVDANLQSIISKLDKNQTLGPISCLNIVDFRNKKCMLIAQTDGVCQLVSLPKADDKSLKRAADRFFLFDTHAQYITQIDQNHALILSRNSNLYLANFESKTAELAIVQDGIEGKISGIEFPNSTEELFITCGDFGISIFYAPTMRVKTKIHLRNRKCNVCKLTSDGSMLISGWCDGVMRAFTPETGKLWFELPNAHRSSITAFDLSKNSNLAASGSESGEIRIWDISKSISNPILPKLEHSMTAHRAAISSIELRETISRLLTSSADGTCTIWDINNYSALKVMFTNAMFQCALYEPLSFSQLISGTSDGKLSFWSAQSGTCIREIKMANATRNETVSNQKNTQIESDDASKQDLAVNQIKFLPQDSELMSNQENEIEKYFAEQKFVAGGADRTLKLCYYDDASVIDESCTHSDIITSLAVSKNGKYAASGAQDGSIYLFKLSD